ncbi:MAG: hypothetical protein U9N18_02240 [Campylobacterota bacterium]|nr:hypothetical protein [Campylobacterota bacterium]
MTVYEAKETIFRKITTEIFSAKQAASVYQNIGKQSSTLNTSRYREFFGLIQSYALSFLILSLGKLFEKPCQRNPNFSILTVLDCLINNLQGVPANKGSLWKLASYLSSNRKEQEALILNPERIKHDLLDDFKNRCPTLPARPGYQLDSAYEGVRVLRDKRVAHSENCDLSCLPKLTGNDIEALIAYCESFKYLVGYGLFGFSMKGFVKPNDLDLLNQTGGQTLRQIIDRLDL